MLYLWRAYTNPSKALGHTYNTLAAQPCPYATRAVGLLNPGGPIAQSQRNCCSISPVEVISAGGVRKNFTSLTDEQAAYWLKRFAKPEFFVNINGKLICVPVEEARA